MTKQIQDEHFSLVRQFKTTDPWKLCKKITQSHAKSFYFASQFLPIPARIGSQVVYAFCRQTDYLVDDLQIPDSQKLKLLETWQFLTKEAFKKGSSPHPLLTAFVEICRKFRIPESLALDLISGVKMDLTIKSYQNYEDLQKYCYLVASVPGLMFMHLLGYSSQKAQTHAIAMGKAMQLTNILRDIKEDYEVGRIYLPRADFRKYNYDVENLQKGLVDKNFQALMKEYIYKAEVLYTFAFQGIKYLNQGRWAAMIAGKTYREILNEIKKQNYDVFRKRAKVSGFKKLILAFGR